MYNTDEEWFPIRKMIRIAKIQDRKREADPEQYLGNRVTLSCQHRFIN